jgi:hypothetical protein
MPKSVTAAGNDESPFSADFVLPSAGDVQKLAKAILAAQEAASAETEAATEALSVAKDKGFHTAAFKKVLAETKKEAEQLADYYAHEAYYREVLGLTARAATVQRLPLEDEAQAAA